MGQAQGIWGDPPSVGPANCTEGGYSQRVPWQGWTFGPGVHAWSHVWQVLLASHGCSGKRTHWEVPSMPCLQSQAAQSPPLKDHGHIPSRVCPPQSPLPGTWKGLDENVLVVTDHFTRYAQVYVSRTQTTEMTAKTLWDKFIVHYGLPEKILMDQGQNFESQLVADLCELMGTQKIWTSPYHPQTNGQCERFNCTLINMLGTLPKEKKSEWKNDIGTLVHAYNCIWNSATGFSPYYLMYGRQPHLPVDVTPSLAPHTITEPSTSKFVQKMKECTKWAQRKAEAFQEKEAQWHKRSYDKRGKAVALEVGDMVLVCVTAFKGHHKIQDRWENREYVVEKWPYPDVPIYVVCPRDGEGHSWTLHRNYLLPSILTQSRMKRTNPWPELSSLDQPAPFRCGTRTTQNWLPWRYQNFSSQADTSSTWNVWISLCICLHAIFCLCIIFWKSTVWIMLH